MLVNGHQDDGLGKLINAVETARLFRCSGPEFTNAEAQLEARKQLKSELLETMSGTDVPALHKAIEQSQSGHADLSWLQLARQRVRGMQEEALFAENIVNIRRSLEVQAVKVRAQLKAIDEGSKANTNEGETNMEELAPLLLATDITNPRLSVVELSRASVIDDSQDSQASLREARQSLRQEFDFARDLRFYGEVGRSNGLMQAIKRADEAAEKAGLDKLRAEEVQRENAEHNQYLADRKMRHYNDEKDKRDHAANFCPWGVLSSVNGGSLIEEKQRKIGQKEECKRAASKERTARRHSKEKGLPSKERSPSKDRPGSKEQRASLSKERTSSKDVLQELMEQTVKSPMSASTSPRTSPRSPLRSALEARKMFAGKLLQGGAQDSAQSSSRMLLPSAAPPSKPRRQVAMKLTSEGGQKEATVVEELPPTEVEKKEKHMEGFLTEWYRHHERKSRKSLLEE
jgi:hypothetical protein